MATLMTLSGFVWGGETSAVPFLNQAVTAREAGMGGASVALVDDASALAVNPGALTRNKSFSVYVTQVTGMEGTSRGSLGLAIPVGKGAMGVGGNYFRPGSVDLTNDTGDSLQRVTPLDCSVAAGYAHGVGIGSLGVAGKYVQSKLGNTASASTVDAGFLSNAFLRQRIRLGVSGTNLTGTVNYDGTEEKLPTQYRAGFLYNISQNWLLAGDFFSPQGRDSYEAMGTEYWVKNGKSWAMAFRAGVNTKGPTVAEGFSGGMGFQFRGIQVDYGLNTMGDSELSHRMTLSYAFVPAPQKTSKTPVSQNQTRADSDKKDPVHFAPWH